MNEAREAEGWQAALEYGRDTPPPERWEVMDDFMTGWRTADRTPRPVTDEMGKAAFLAFMGMDEQSFLEMSPRYRAGSIAQGRAALEAAEKAA